jgi:transcriptional regulator NrdR family protein
MTQQATKRDSSDRGLRWRQCGAGRLRVVYTRHAPGGKVVRQRECRACGARVTTWERVVGVVKD